MHRPGCGWGAPSRFPAGCLTIGGAEAGGGYPCVGVGNAEWLQGGGGEAGAVGPIGE
jgi:hypothetical protein